MSEVLSVGPHVFGDGRLGLWVIQNSSLRDKLRHVLPRLRNVAPVTDIFLPGGRATRAHAEIVKENNFFVAAYSVPMSGESPEVFAYRALTELGAIGAAVLELNVELPDEQIAPFIRKAVAFIRKKRPYMRMRVNIAPFKAQFLPVDLILRDKNLYVIEQAYLGNMDSLVPADHCLRDLLSWGVPLEKASVMYAAHCSPRPGKPRVPALPLVDRYRGSIYSDDLLLDSGLL